jgi:hypothetical protein
LDRNTVVHLAGVKMGEAQTATISDGRMTEATFEMNGTTFHRVAVTQDIHEGDSSSDDGGAEDSWIGEH